MATTITRRGRRAAAKRADGEFQVRVATAEDREAIYRLRHRVYAEELGQHPRNAEGVLTDALDAFNTYLVVRRDRRIAGFVSITTPEAPAYSIDKYAQRDVLPIAFDDGLFEVRLLTVVEPFRGTEAAVLLCCAALEWIAARGGTRVVCIGRREVVPLYEKFGLQRMGATFRGGRVEFEVMTASVEALRETANGLVRATPGLARIPQRVGEAGLSDACFHGGAFFDAIGPRFGDLSRRRRVINADVLDAWFDPSPAVIASLSEHLPWLLRTSPPTHCEGLVEAIAESRGVARDNILVGAGSSDLIFLALREWLTPASRVLLPEPTYGEYVHVCEKVIGCQVDRLLLRRENGYRIDADELRDVLRRGYDLAVIVNPNSPTGRLVPGEALRRVAREAPVKTRLWVDETYIEYCGTDHSLERLATESSNIVVCKSMSKVYALSGARAAYLCAGRATVARLRRLSPPWAVSLPAQVAAVAAVGDRAYYAARWAETHALRRVLERGLAGLGLEVIPGVANFTLCHLTEAMPTAAQVVARCRDQGVFLRDASTMGRSLGERALRVAVKDAETQKRVVEVLGAAIGRGH